MTTTIVDVQILGRTFKLNCPVAQIEALKSAANDLTLRINELKQKSFVTNVDQLLVTVALNISHELSQEKQKKQNYADDIEQRITLLQSTIEQALIEQSTKL